MVATTVAASLSLDLLDQTEPRHWWGITRLNSSWKHWYILGFCMFLLVGLHCPWQWSAEQSALWRCRVCRSMKGRGAGGAGTVTWCTCKQCSSNCCPSSWDKQNLTSIHYSSRCKKNRVLVYIDHISIHPHREGVKKKQLIHIEPTSPSSCPPQWAPGASG